jgi:hypothetical protein
MLKSVPNPMDTSKHHVMAIAAKILNLEVNEALK